MSPCPFCFKKTKAHFINVSRTNLFYVFVLILPTKHVSVSSFIYLFYLEILTKRDLNSFVLDSIFPSNYTLQVQFY